MMRILDSETRLEIENPDLSVGCLCETAIIRSGIGSIDNINKFAYSDEDYERVKLYYKYTQQDLEDINFLSKPTQEERLTDLENQSDYIKKAYKSGVNQS